MKIYSYLLSLTFTLTLLSGCGLNNPYSAKKVFTEPDVIKLAQAASQGDTKTIDELMALGVNLEATGKDNLTPLYWSFAYVPPSPEAKRGFQHLLQNGANPMHIHPPSNLPLLHMVARGDDFRLS